MNTKFSRKKAFRKSAPNKGEDIGTVKVEDTSTKYTQNKIDFKSHTFMKASFSIGSICVVCFKKLTIKEKKFIFMCSYCSMLVHFKCIDKIFSLCYKDKSLSKDDTPRKSHEIIKMNSLKILNCQLCGKIIYPFVQSISCKNCEKIFHLSCQSRISQNCLIDSSRDSRNLGKLLIKLLNTYNSNKEYFCMIIIIMGSEFPFNSKEGYGSYFVKIIQYTENHKMVESFTTKTIMKNINPIFNECFKIKLESDNLNGYFIIELHRILPSKKSLLLGCMKFYYQYIFRITQSYPKWFKVLPIEDGINNNMELISNKILDLNNLANKFLSSSSGNKEKIDKPEPDIENKNDNCIKLENFKLLKIIGKGAFSKVILGECFGKKSFSGYYALKILNKDKYIKGKNVAAAINEKNIIALQNVNPFVLQGIASFHTREYVCFVFEFFNGGDLFFYLSKIGRFEENMTRFYVCEVVEALIFLHSNNIIYRDLKCENILLQKSGHIKLIDFSVSKPNVSSLDKTFTFCGTSEYLAPETIKMIGQTHQVDWWSLGILIFYLLNGEFPFVGLNEKDLFEKIKTSDVFIPDSVNDSTKSLIKDLLAKEPEERLGYGLKGELYLRSHTYFNGISWNVVREQKLDPPIIPVVSGDQDISNFDEEFTKSLLQLTPPNESLLSLADGNLFEDIEFSREI